MEEIFENMNKIIEDFKKETEDFIQKLKEENNGIMARNFRKTKDVR